MAKKRALDFFAHEIDAKKKDLRIFGDRKRIYKSTISQFHRQPISSHFTKFCVDVGFFSYPEIDVCIVNLLNSYCLTKSSTL